MDYLTNTQFIGIVAVIVGVISQFSYIVSILKGKTHPHLFTWVVWSILGFIGFAAQLHGHAGPGAWTVGVGAGLCFLTAVLAIPYGEKNFTYGDKVALTASLAALLPWMVTDDPLGSVILICIIDAVGFYPTLRKSWNKPQEEHLLAYNLGSLKFLISLFALDNITWITALYPAAIVVINSTFTVICLARRHIVAQRLATS